MFVPEYAYLMIGYPRSGTNVLAAALADTGMLGHPREYFYELFEEHHAREVGVDSPTNDNYATYVDAVLRAGSTPNGVFGAKLFSKHAKNLLRRTRRIPEFADLAPINRLWAPFGQNLRLVFLRRNCLRSAVSLWRAEVTNVWTRVPGDEPAPTPPLDLYALSVAHAEVHAADLGWSTILTASGIDPLVVSYDDIATDLAAVVRAIATQVGVAVANVPAPRYERQADDATDHYVAEWTARTGGCSVCRSGPFRE